LQGGFIWDFSDQTFLRQDEKGNPIWAYGSDLGTVGATSDTSFCADGLFQANRQPHPQAFEMKQVYAPVAFAAAGLSANEVLVTNRYDFTNLNTLRLNWRLRMDGVDISAGEIPSVHLPPHESTIVSLPIPPFQKKPGKAYFLFVEAHTIHATESLPADFLLAREQIFLPNVPAQEITLKHYGQALTIKRKEKSIHIFNQQLQVDFDTATGWLSSYSVNGLNFLIAPLMPDFWRPVTDNDIGNSLQVRCAVWKDAASFATLQQLKVTPMRDSSVEVFSLHYLPTVNTLYRTTFLIWPDGSIDVCVNFVAGDSSQPELPRFGMKTLVNESFDEVSWLGRGPFDNYADRKAAAFKDVYTLKAADFFHPYPRAQESGYRTEVNWATLKDKQGEGFMLQAEKPLCIGVLHFDRTKMEFNRTKNIHGGSMEQDPFIWLNIDLMQMGLGGDNSWGSRTHAMYTIPYRDYQYAFKLSPLQFKSQ
jgi:beta-galactosidase